MVLARQLQVLGELGSRERRSFIKVCPEAVGSVRVGLLANPHHLLFFRFAYSELFWKNFNLFGHRVRADHYNNWIEHRLWGF